MADISCPCLLEFAERLVQKSAPAVDGRRETVGQAVSTVYCRYLDEDSRRLLWSENVNVVKRHGFLRHSGNGLLAPASWKLPSPVVVD
jgi:hypothetical protein